MRIIDKYGADRLILGADVRNQRWGKVKFPDYHQGNYALKSDLFKDNYKITLGGEYCPLWNSRRFLERVRYRIGAGYTTPYYVAAGTTATAPIAGTTATLTDLTSIPAAGSAGTPVEVYIWYEGEDENCMSDNARAAELDDIDVDIKFELKEVQ